MIKNQIERIETTLEDGTPTSQSNYLFLSARLWNSLKKFGLSGSYCGSYKQRVEAFETLIGSSDSFERVPVALNDFEGCWGIWKYDKYDAENNRYKYYHISRDGYLELMYIYRKNS